MSDPEELSPQEREAWLASDRPYRADRLLEQSEEYWIERADELRQALLQGRLWRQRRHDRLDMVMSGLRMALDHYFSRTPREPEEQPNEGA